MGRSYSGDGDSSGAFSDCNSDRSGDLSPASKVVAAHHRLLISCDVDYDDDVVRDLISDLESPSVPIESQRHAAMVLRLLAKHKMENRLKIARAGAVRPLVALLSHPDPQLQEHGDADKKGLSTIAEEVKHLAQKAKDNSLKPEDYELISWIHGITNANLGNPIIQFVPIPYTGDLCDRVSITGVSRLSLRSYANSRRVTLQVSEALPERLHGKIMVCFHRNVARGLCQCEMDEWQTLQNGQWSAVLSPFEYRYIDVNFKDRTSTSFTISIKEEFQQWHLACLGFGFLLLLSAPIISNWVPFYYCSSMALGILLILLIILYQVMKLLPRERKIIMCLAIYGSVQLGAGSYIAHYFSTVVNSIFVNFGLSEEMHNPVLVILSVGIILSGAALGYWIVQKFVLSEDDNVDAGIAQFVRWAMRIISVVFFFQSTLVALLALVALVIYWSICFLITSIMRQTRAVRGSLWHQRAQQTSASNRYTKFLSPYSWSSMPLKGHDYYSTYHRMPSHKFSKKEWEDFTRESTRLALIDWASTPEVARWIADHAQHMQLNPHGSFYDTMESSTGSSKEVAGGMLKLLTLLKWFFN